MGDDQARRTSIDSQVCALEISEMISGTTHMNVYNHIRFLV